jgi:hypothetical protein
MATIPSSYPHQTPPDATRSFWPMEISKAQRIFNESVFHLSTRAPSLIDRTISIKFDPDLSLSRNFANLTEKFDPEINLKDVVLQLTEDGCFALVQEMLPKVLLSEEDKAQICLVAAKYFDRYADTTSGNLVGLCSNAPAPKSRRNEGILQIIAKTCDWLQLDLIWIVFQPLQ